MDGPWSDYAPAPGQGSAGPWSDYQAPQQTAPWHDYQRPAPATDVRVGNQSAAFPTPPAPKPEEPGLLSSIGQAARAGVSEDIRNVAGLPGTLAGKPQGQPAAPKPWEEPLSLADLAHPSRALPKITYQLAGSGSTLGAGIAGGIAGEAIEPAGGGLVGGALAAGTMTAINQLTPLFAEEMKKPNADPDHAFNAALERAGQAGVFSGAGWAAFGAKMFAGPVKNLLFQAFGVQPGMAVAERGLENVEQGQPVGQGLPSAALQAVVGTAVPLAGTEAARAGAEALRGRPGPAAAPQPGAVPPPAPATPAPGPTIPPLPPGARPLDVLEHLAGQAVAPTPQPAAPAPPELPNTRAAAAPPPPGPRSVADIVAAEGVSPAQAKLIQEREIDAMRAAGVEPPQPAHPEISGAYTTFRPGDLTIQPDVMQFKASDERGVTGALTGVQRWEPALANPITVWQANDGRNVVVNGHQRYDLATRAEAAGQQDVQIPAKVFREADGYTPEYMRTLGAFQNIAEGSATAIDAAKVMRAPAGVTADLRLPDLPPRSAMVRDAQGLASLSPQAFGVVENGVVPPEQAAHVGELLTDPHEQMAALDVLARAHPANAQQARLMVQDVSDSGFLKGAQTTLFGDEAFAQSLVAERARVLDNALQTLRRTKGVFRGAVEGEGTLAAAGNKLDTAANEAGRTENAQLIDTLARDATKRGELSEALNAAARDLAGGKRLAGTTADFLARARAIVRRGPAEGVQTGAPDHSAGPEGESEPAVEGQSPLFARPPKPPAAGAPLFGEAPPERERRETPASLADKAALERQGQAVLPGMEPSARQAQAARDQAGPRGGQAPANEGLFAPRPPDQKPLFQKADERPTAAAPDPDAIQAFVDNAQRIVGPNARVILHQPEPGGAIMVRHPDGSTEPVNGMALGRLILAAVQPDRTQWTLDHESVHLLRNLGVFSPKEWKALEVAALRENWLKKYDIERDYSDHPRDQQIEEAIAQRFADGMANPSRDPFVRRMVQAFHDFLARLRGVLAGHGFQNADDVFARMASGEVGQREPGSGMPQRGPQTVPESAEVMGRWLRSGEEAPRFQKASQRPIPSVQTVKPDSAAKRAGDEIKAILSPTSRGPKAKSMEYAVREHTAALAQSSQIAAHALEDARRTVAALPEREQLAVTDRAEKGAAQPTAELNAAIGALRRAQDEWLGKIRGLGKGYLDDAIQDYMGHIWSNYREWSAGQQTAPTQAQMDEQNRSAAAAKRPLRGRGEFLKPRTFDTQAEGMAAGLIPATTNPIDMQLLKLRSMQRFYHGTRFAEALKQSGLATWVPVDDTGSATAAGYAKLDDTVFQPRIRSDAQYGVVETGNWMAPEPAARVFNNYMSQGLMASVPTIYEGIRGTANALNGLQLGFSGFHATFTALDSMHSQTALGLQQLSKGDVGKGLATLATAPAAPYTTFKRGAALRQAYLDPASASPEIKPVLDAMIRGGGRIGMDSFYRSTASGPFFRTLKDLKNPSGAFNEAWQMVKPSPGDPLGVQASHILSGALRIGGRLVDTSMQPLMGYVVPRMKLGVFSNMAQDWLARNPGAGPEQVSEAMTKAWDSVDNRMGQLVYDNLFWNKTLKDLAFITTRSVGWNVGTIRELGGAAVDTAAQGRQLLRGRAPELTNRMAYAIAMTVNSAIIGATMTYLATGKGPQSLMDYFYPPDGTVQPNGAMNRLSIPGYVKDVIDWTKAPIQTALNKTNPLLETGAELINNRDYYGGIIYHSGRDNPFLAYPEYLLNQTLPFSARATMKLHGQGATPSQQLLGFWGIQPAPQSIVNPAKGEAYNRRQDNLAYKRRLKENAQGRISLE
jgi:hypothetical protein